MGKFDRICCFHFLGFQEHSTLARKKSVPNFEKSLEELEKLVETMENGDISLEDSLKYFERGIELTRLCQKSLKEAEQKVEILVGQDQQNNLKPFTDLTE